MLTIATLLAVLLAPALEQEQPGAEPWKAESAFDTAAASLPAKFEGNTVPWVLRYGTPLPRLARETAAEYDARRQAFLRETFAFVLDEHRYAYDRASETVTVTVQPTLISLGEIGSYATAFDVHRRKLPPSTRAGPDRRAQTYRPTVFDRGAVTAATRIWKQSRIALADSPTGFKSTYEPLVFHVKMSPDRARRVKPNLRVAFICIPALDQEPPAGDPSMPEAHTVDANVAIPGTFSDETITYSFVLRAELMQVWLFDRSTGEVYGRFTQSRETAPRTFR